MEDNNEANVNDEKDNDSKSLSDFFFDNSEQIFGLIQAWMDKNHQAGINKHNNETSLQRSRLELESQFKVQELKSDEVLAQKDHDLATALAEKARVRDRNDKIFKVIVLVLVLGSLVLLLVLNKDVTPLLGFFGIVVGAVFSGDVVNRVTERRGK